MLVFHRIVFFFPLIVMHKWIVTYSKSLKFFYQFSLRVIVAKTYNPNFLLSLTFYFRPFLVQLVLSLFLAQNITKMTCKKKLEKKNYYKPERFSLIAIISRIKRFKINKVCMSSFPNLHFLRWLNSFIKAYLINSI